MLKIIIDTNVLVSSFIGKSYPKTIVFDIILGKKVLLCVSPQVVKEYVQVLNRDKFLRYPQFVTKSEIVLNKMEELGKVFEPKMEVSIIKDAPDNRFLELAMVSNADYLITGNTNDFTMNSFGNTKIVTPEEFIQQNPTLTLYQ